MNPLGSLRPITRRAIPIFYQSPGICHLPEPEGSGSGSSTPSELEFDAVTRLAGPTGLEAVVAGADVTLSWTSPSYAYSSVIYRSDVSADGPFTLVAANVFGEEYVDEGLSPGTYWYKVTSIEPNYGETYPSDVVEVIVV